MSQGRRKRRELERANEKIFNVFGKLLSEFYAFLEQKNKPTDQEVRTEFVKRDKEWKHYCAKNHLTHKASLLFNQEVAASWKKKYAKKS